MRTPIVGFKELVLRPAAWAGMLLCALPIASHATLDVSIAVNPNPAQAGETLNVQIIVTNTDGFDRTDVTLESNYPADLDQLFETEFDGDCPSTTCNTGEVVFWSLGTVPAGGSVFVDMPPFVSAGVASGTVIPFDAIVSDGVDNASATTSVEVQPAFYQLSLGESSDPVLIGSTLTYTLSFSLLEGQPVTETVISLPLPAEVSFVSASDGGSFAAGAVEWDLGFLNPGERGVRRVVVDVGAGLSSGTPFETQAVIASASGPDQARATALTTTEANVPLGLSVIANPGPAENGELSNIELTVSNPGVTDRAGVVLEARYPQGLDQLFETEFDGDCVSTTCNPGELVSWDLGEVPAGTSVTVDMTPTLTSIDGELITFFARAYDVQGGEQRQVETLIADSDPVFDVALSENADPAATGGELSYTVSFSLLGGGPVADTTLQLALPDAVSFVSASDGGVLIGDTVEWELGFLSPGTHGLRRVIVEVDAGLAPGAIFEAEAVALDASDMLEQSRAKAVTTADIASPIALSIATTPSPAKTDEIVNVQLTVSNPGPVDRAGVIVQTRFPQGLFQLFETQFDGDCTSTTCNDGERVSWDLGTLAAGASVTVDLPPQVSSSLEGELVKFFSVVEDAQGAALRELSTLIVDNDPVYDLSVAEDSDPVLDGGELTYTLSFSLLEGGPFTATTLALALPDGVTLASASDGGVLAGNTVEWDLGFIGPGDRGQRRVTVAVDGGLPLGTALEAEAVISSQSDPLEQLRSEAVTTVVSDVPLQLSIATSAGPAATDELTYIEFTVSNPGPVDRAGVVLQTRYPQGLFQLFETEFTGDCESTTCNDGEPVTWDLGTIEAGGSVTVNLPPTVSSATDGELLNLFTVVRDAQGGTQEEVETLIVDNDAIFDLSLSDGVDPVGVNVELTYTLAFSLLDTAAVTESVLRMPLPAGVSFVSASDGGQLTGNTVEWDLGFLAPGEGGRRQLVVRTNDGATAGRALEAAAVIVDASSSLRQLRAEATTAVAQSGPLTINTTSAPNPALTDDVLDIKLMVENNDSVDRVGVQLFVKYPQGLFQLFETDFTGDCPSTTCNAGEIVVWDLGTIPAGGFKEVTLPPQVSAPLDGTLINFFAWTEDVSGATARALETVRVGLAEPVDNDGDGVPNEIDNCTEVFNPDQRDVNNDGFGNICDPDLDNDGSVTFLDLGIMKQVFFLPDPFADLDGDGTVSFTDLGIMKGLIFQPPGPSGLVP